MINLFFTPCSLTYPVPSVESRETSPRKETTAYIFPDGITKTKGDVNSWERGRMAAAVVRVSRGGRVGGQLGGRASAGDVADLGILKLSSGAVRLVMVCAQEKIWDMCYV